LIKKLSTRWRSPSWRA